MPLEKKRIRRLTALLGFAFTLTLSLQVSALDQQATTLEFSERVVAGGPSDSVTVRHLQFRGSQRAIGEKMAQIVQSRYERKASRLGATKSRQRAEYFESAYPMHFQRSLGVADHFGETTDKKRDTSLLPYNLPTKFGCSVAYYPPNFSASGHGSLSRNYDWSTGSWVDLLGPGAAKDDRPNTQDPYVIEMYPDEGYASLYLCAYELLGTALDGVNSEGLTVAILTNSKMPGNPTPSNRYGVGLSELEIVRFLLETCANVDEARKALASIKTYYMMVPCHYIIGDRTGHSFVWEYSYDLKQRFTIDGEDQPQWVTNHSLEGFPTVKSIPASLASKSTFKRFKRMGREIERSPEKATVENMKRATDCVSSAGLGSRGSGKVLSRTLWHALYDCQDSSLDIDFYLGEKTNGRGEKRSGYIRFQLEH